MRGESTKIMLVKKQTTAIVGTLQKIIVKGKITTKLNKNLNINQQQSKYSMNYLQTTPVF
jgi:hypothetical protein